ncbi:MAG: class I SAM-dependent DNA methyltransferase, partial [Lachnospira sp.]
VYDEYMDNIPYEEWGEYMMTLLKENGVSDGMSVLELGCGTGTVTRMLSKSGYDCVGLDMSEDMLSIASDKTFEEDLHIIYTCQDMRDFEVPYSMDAMISIGDSMNYITCVDDLENVFSCVRENLKENGVFIFDLKTIHFFRDILADNTYAQNRDDSAFIWDNYYDEEERNNEYELAVFVKNEDGTFDRFEEQHYQHGFTIEEVTGAARKAGLNVKSVYNAFTKDAPDDSSERLYFIITR